ncbi:unnamed protein product [Closterium sp. Yama58-4]|nr:unnamed protein product [Closterium sp. Yama58-4]
MQAICLEGEAGPTGMAAGLSAAVCGSKLSVQFMWSFSYWSAYFLTWVIIPIMQGYEDAGDFTAKERLRTSVRTNLMLIGIVGAVAVVGIIILLATKEMAWDNIVSLAIGASNAFALITGALLLGYGLVEIPRGLWSHADLAERHKWLSVRVARAAQRLDQAHQELSTAIVIAQATSLQMPRHDPLRPMMEIIDAMASEDAGFKPSGGQIGENDMDYDADAKSMAALRRRLRNAQDNYSRCKTEYCTVVWEALQLEETLHNCYQGTGRYTSYLRAPRKGFFAPFLDVVEWWWRCAIRSHVVRAFALLLGLISLAILFAEATLLSQKWVDLSLFSVLVRAAALHGEAVQLIVFVPLVYLCVCTYFSLFKLGMFSFYYLVPGHTDSVSLLINCSMVSRYAAPMCYNFLSLIHLRHYNYVTGSVEPLVTVFEKRMGVLPKSFDRVYPLCMVAWSLLIALNVHHRLFDSVTHLLSHCRGLYSRTWRRLRFDDDDEGEDVGVDGRRVVVKGHMILQRERATIERGLPVGESVVPLARHFSSKDLHASSSASSLLSGHYSTPTKVPHTDPSSSSSADPLLDSRLAAVRPAGGKPAADSATTKDPEAASLLRAADTSSASVKYSGIIATGAAAGGSSAGGSARKPQRPPAGGASGASSGAASPAAGAAARVGLEASIKSSSAGDLLPLGREKSRQASVPGSPLLLSQAASPLVTARLPPISTSAHSTPHHLSTAVAAAPAGSVTPTRPLSPPSLLSSALGLSSAAMVSTPQRYLWSGQATAATAAGAGEQQELGTRQGSNHAVGVSPTESPLISGQRGAAAGAGSGGTIPGNSSSSSHWSQTLLESRWSQAVTSRLRDASSSSTMGRLRDILGSPRQLHKDEGDADTTVRSGGGSTQEAAPDLDRIFESLHARRAAAHTEDDMDDFEDQHGLLRTGMEQQTFMASSSRPILSFQPRLSLTSLQGFEEATLRVNPPSVVFDNQSDPVATLVKVDSANKQGCLLQVVRLLTDLDLVISKAYISSDGGWFVDVFHVVDQLGQKVTDESLIQFIKKALGATKDHPDPDAKTCLGKPVADEIDFEHSVIELTGYDRPGLLYEVSEVLTKLGCNVVGAEVWTHNNRVAIVVHITHAVNGGPVTHPAALAEMHDSLCSVMESDSIRIEARNSFFVGEAQTDRRLHQLMFADRDYEAAGIHVSPAGAADEKLRPSVSVGNLPGSQYTIIKLSCLDRPKLLFDTVCTLTDMQYIIHHATIESEDDVAFQELYIRTTDGSMLDTEAERERVVKCLEAAILRRTPKGMCLDLCAGDRVGKLSEKTGYHMALSPSPISFEPKISMARSSGFEEAALRVNPPRVVFDNHSDPVSTLVKVDSANKQGCLLQVVQLLTDLDLVISKAYISSDGGWFVDVFHVVDQLGQKVTDKSLIRFIEKALGASKEHPVPDAKTCLGKPVADAIDFEHSVIELTGYDRPGILYEVSEVLTKLGCNVVGAEVWTHNNRVAFILHVTEATNGGPVSEAAVLTEMRERLCSVMESNSIRIESRSSFFVGEAQTDRRLHQLLFADRDYETMGLNAFPTGVVEEKVRPSVSVANSPESQYTIIKLTCVDRRKLLFDTVCTLTDMQYIIHHATIESENDIAHQEYYVRTMDGSMLDTEAERERVGKCLEAAILRRSPRGLCLDLCTGDRVGLLCDVTRVFQTHNLSITAANIYQGSSTFI